MLPNAKRVGVPFNPGDDADNALRERLVAAAPKYGLELVLASVDNTNDIPQRIQTFAGKVDAIYVFPSNLFQPATAQIGAIAGRLGIPAFNGLPSPVLKNEMLASYSIDYPGDRCERGGAGGAAVQGREGRAPSSRRCRRRRSTRSLSASSNSTRCNLEAAGGLYCQLSQMRGEVTAEDKAALRIAGVSKVFNRGTSTERRALNGIDLSLSEGDFAVLIGSNGAGKSTLLAVVAGDVAPDAGSVVDRRHGCHRRAGAAARRPRGAGVSGPVARHRAGSHRRGKSRHRLQARAWPLSAHGGDGGPAQAVSRGAGAAGPGAGTAARYAGRSSLRRPAAGVVADHGLPAEAGNPGARRALRGARSAHRRSGDEGDARSRAAIRASPPSW